MKVYFRGFAARIPEFAGMEPYFRFALSQDISLAVISCDNPTQVEENVGFAESFKAMIPEEKQALIDQIAPYARQLMYNKP